MQAHLLVGPIPITGCGGSGFLSVFDSNLLLAVPRSLTGRRHRRTRRSHQFSPLIVASSAAEINGEQDHYTVLGLTQSASSIDIKRAYRLLARKYHPDVSKDSRAAEIFKSIRHSYEILSNDVTRMQYDQALRFQENNSRPYRGKWNYNTEFEDGVRIYSWDELRQKIRRERYYEHYNVNEETYDCETDDDNVEGSLDEDRGSFSEVLRSVFVSLFLFQTLGSRISLTFSSLMALFDRKLDAGYKIGYVIAWVLGGRGGMLLTLCLSFASWVCGKTSSSIVALVVVAMWVGSNLARFAPLPQGALLTLLYMSIKLQVDQN
ncbi:Chaperone protein dnaJ [Quillaja saponaria]|uniref:Chaperone protein dnaJ n=1 Tax=Quillaja saponaria TaxID=32244 RepID=A0AAD7PZ67_QUISA|nr:Chaperone protein dnaJ [Quillaja saponaria]